VGLDWNPGNKAKPGSEVEFADLFGRITAADTGGRRDALVERFHQISITAFETLGAPVVGRDSEADRWARQLHVDIGSDEPEEAFLAQLDGFAVLPLVPPCDGLPRYTNGSPGGYVEQYAFRAQFLHDCTDDIGEELLAAAYVSKLPEELLIYGRRLLAKAKELADRHALDPMNLVIPDEIPTPTTSRPASVRQRRGVLSTASMSPTLRGDGVSSGRSAATSSTRTGEQRGTP
jgi:hypothetical protein